MPELTMLRGLQASGKSTYAKAQVAARNDVTRVNKDEIRAELAAQGVTWSRQVEKQQVIPIRDRRIIDALRAGLSVIVDDTNLAPEHEARLRQLAQQNGASFIVKDFEITLEEAIARDAKREGAASIGEAAIRKTAQQFLPHLVDGVPCAPYVHTDGLPWCLICDLDGTAALMGDRSPYDASRCDELDAPNPAVHFILSRIVMAEGWTPHLAHDTTALIYLSGREEKDREPTLRFLQRHTFPSGSTSIYPPSLYMRPTGDRRKDSIVKGELFDKHVRGRYNVRLVLDDRTSVVTFWRSIGLCCLQVAEGNF